MKTLFGYFAKFYREELRWLYLAVLLVFLVGTTWIFYSQKSVAALIGGGAAGAWRFPANLAVFGISFAVPLLLYYVFNRYREALRAPGFWFMAGTALLIFCFKVYFWWQRPLAMAYAGNEHVSYWQNCFTNLISAGLLSIPVLLYWFFIDRKERPFYGWSTKRVEWKPYLIIMALMIPLVLLAAQQHDFQQQYPKAEIVLKRGGITGNHTGHLLFFEGCYGLDFFATELFFRGFLVIGLSKYLGRGAILPAAVFYVFIHYGKPLGETVSSFIGGTALGILAYETQSIWGGVLLHLGTAWAMEGLAYVHF